MGKKKKNPQGQDQRNVRGHDTADRPENSKDKETGQGPFCQSMVHRLLPKYAATCRNTLRGHQAALQSCWDSQVWCLGSPANSARAYSPDIASKRTPSTEVTFTWLRPSNHKGARLGSRTNMASVLRSQDRTQYSSLTAACEARRRIGTTMPRTGAFIY